MKKQPKKLTLGKKTVSNLSTTELNRRVGGSDFTCTTCATHCCSINVCVTNNTSITCNTCAKQATCYKHGHTC